jgi:predicted phosphoribosyltransferase
VLAIPRGGVVTGAVLARALGAELDVVLSRKLRAPGQPELAIGALAEGGELVLSDGALEIEELTDDYLAAERQHQLVEIQRRQAMFRSARRPAAVEGRSVIVTDDGIATGSTMIAALRAVRALKPRELIVAVPVGPPERVEAIRRLCDEVVCLLSPASFWSVGQFYEHFEPVEDEEAVRLLREFAPAAPLRAVTEAEGTDLAAST